MTALTEFGWNDFHEQHYIDRSLSAGRVISVKGFRYTLITASGELEAELSGRLLFAALPEDLPKVGDWVLFMPYGSEGYITHVIPRVNTLTRKSPGNKTEKQVLAANIDCAVIVQGLDRDFNIMRLERYLVQLAACNISSLVILNKADLIDNPEEYRSAVSSLGRDCQIHFCSTLTGLGVGELMDQVLQRAKTYILIGSSGVGKSSLINALMRADVQSTGDVSAWSEKGKHTTSRRDLFCLPNGSLVIDTPGMREFGVTGEEMQDAQELFPAVYRFAASCRFSDCSHTGEPGCAVAEALTNGDLDAHVYHSYLKLVKEQKRFTINMEDKKRTERQFGRLTREARNHRKKYKY